MLFCKKALNYHIVKILSVKIKCLLLRVIKNQHYLCVLASLIVKKQKRNKDNIVREYFGGLKFLFILFYSVSYSKIAVVWFVYHHTLSTSFAIA